MSRRRDDGSFAGPRKVWGVNSEDDDIMPNVRVGSRGLLEMVFSSNRATRGCSDLMAFGDQDVYVSCAILPGGRWSKPKNLGPAINTSVNEQRATLSADGSRMYFGRPGGQVLVSERSAH